MHWLSDPRNMLTVLNYYEKKRTKAKEKAFKELKNEIFNIFTSSIPVYTAILRTEMPGEKGGKVFKLKVNTCYTAMIRLTNSVNAIDREDYLDKMHTINKQLYAVQREIRGVFDDTYVSLKDKQGILMSKVVGKLIIFCPLYKFL